jgi:hypothetical protein
MAYLLNTLICVAVKRGRLYRTESDGLDHGIGHLASMSPEKNEQLTPAKVETSGRPRHP